VPRGSISSLGGVCPNITCGVLLVQQIGQSRAVKSRCVARCPFADQAMTAIYRDMVFVAECPAVPWPQSRTISSFDPAIPSAIVRATVSSIILNTVRFNATLPTSTSVGQWIAPNDGRESGLDMIASMLRLIASKTQAFI
jgi:hypothetical protein